jgi:site-specific recombinase XerD
VLLTLLRLGLRAGEVVVHDKGRHEDRLPLPTEVGEVVAAYLRRGRQNGTAHREVFLRALAPVGPLGAGGISAIVRHACARAGVPVIRAHRLRHALACWLAEAATLMPVIAEVLRHRAISTTSDYARVDIEGLRSVAQPWPRGEAR